MLLSEYIIRVSQRADYVVDVLIDVRNSNSAHVKEGGTNKVKFGFES